MATAATRKPHFVLVNAAVALQNLAAGRVSLTLKIAGASGKSLIGQARETGTTLALLHTRGVLRAAIERPRTLKPRDDEKHRRLMPEMLGQP